jgi:hypothetical protein
MLLIIAISIILLLPILSYLLHPLSTQKSTVFLISFFLFGGFVLNFQSTNSLIGSWVQAAHSGSITKVISRNGQLESNILNKYLEYQSSQEESFLLGVEIFYKALEHESFDSAESILRLLNIKFSTENFQVPIFNLLADLRDSKYPNIADSQLLLNLEKPLNCSIQSLEFFVSIPGGPEVDIASKKITSVDISTPFKLNKSDALVRGFDITSAFLQQETIKIEALVECADTSYQSFKTIDLKYSKDNIEQVFFYANEWLKK